MFSSVMIHSDLALWNSGAGDEEVVDGLLPRLVSRTEWDSMIELVDSIGISPTTSLCLTYKN